MKRYYFFLTVLLSLDLYGSSTNSVRGSLVTQGSTTLKGSEAFSLDQQDDQATEKAMTEVQKALEEYEWKIYASCPNTVKLLNDPKFLTPIMPTLTEKFLTEPRNSSILKTFFKQIPFLRINDQPITPAYMTSLNNLAKSVQTFLEEYKRAKDSIQFKQKYYKAILNTDKTVQDHTKRVKGLANPITDILKYASTLLTQVRKNLLYQDFYSVTSEKTSAERAFNETKSILSFINTLLNWDVFKEVRETLLPEVTSTTIGDKINKLLSEVPLEGAKTSQQRSLHNSTAIVDVANPIKELETISKSALKFSLTKVPASTELADNLDQQGHIIFKIIKGQGLQVSDTKPKITIRFFDPTEKGQFIRTQKGMTDISFPSDVDKYLKTLKKDFNDLRDEYRIIQTKSNALIALSAAASGMSISTQNRQQSIQHKPAEQKLNLFSGEILTESQEFLRRVKALQNKMNIAVNLETLGDYEDIDQFPQGLYIFVNPQLHFGTSHSIKDLVKSLQFKSGNAINLRKDKAYSMSYSTWENMPFRSRASLIRSAGQFFSRMGTTCNFNFTNAKACGTNFPLFLHSVRYCKPAYIESCLSSAAENPSITKILENLFVHIRNEENLSQTSEKSEVILTKSNSMKNTLIEEQKIFAEDGTHKENVVWFILLVELLQREATLDRSTGFRSQRETDLYLEKLLIDAAYHISSIANNIGFSFLNTRALTKLRTLSNLPTHELEKKRNEFLDNMEVSQKMQLLNLSNELSRIGSAVAELNLQANMFGRMGAMISRVTSTSDAIRQDTINRAFEAITVNIASGEERTRLRQELGLESGSERQNGSALPTKRDALKALRNMKFNVKKNDQIKFYNNLTEESINHRYNQLARKPRANIGLLDAEKAALLSAKKSLPTLREDDN